MKKKIALIIGAGAAGMSAAYEFAVKSDIRPIVIEAENAIGGLAKTFDYNGLKADIGPHRFFTKDDEVMKFWKDVLPLQGENAKDDNILGRKTDFKEGITDPEMDDKVFLRRRRFSRIYYMN